MPGGVQVVQIGEDNGRVALLVDGVVQSISPADGLASGGYWAAMVPRVRPRSALILGLGGGTLASLMIDRWGDGIRIVGVDDDIAIVETARAAGWLPEDVEVVIADAIAFTRTCATRFDFVAVDLYRGERFVAQGLTRPVLTRVRSLLTERGRLAANLFVDRQLSARLERIGALFQIDDRVEVGGNVIVHAHSRR